MSEAHQILGTPLEALQFALSVAKHDGVAAMEFLEGWEVGDVTGFPGYQDFVNTESDGHQTLWRWFGLSRASFLTIPRVLLHAMPDQWQGKLAALLREYDEAFPNRGDMPSLYVSARKGRKFVSLPDWLLNYRHPRQGDINELRKR